MVRASAISVRVSEEVKQAAQKAADDDRRTLASFVEKALVDYLEFGRDSANGSFGYGWEKFFKAVDHLATSAAPLRERVRDAYIYNLMYLREENLPADLWQKFYRIKERLTRVAPQGDEGTVEATVRTMSADELREVASEIFSMHDTITARIRRW